MEYMGDRDWWNQRFKVRELKIMVHEKCLEEDIKYFAKGGRILDVACGDGRNSVYLVRLGYKVTAIDFCEEALKRLNYFMDHESIKIDTKLVDLSKVNSLVNIEKVDGIIINHYRLNSELYKTLMELLNPGGILWVNGFEEIPMDNPNITEADILREDDFRALDGYKLEKKKSYEIGERKFVRYIWRK